MHALVLFLFSSTLGHRLEGFNVLNLDNNDVTVLRKNKATCSWPDLYYSKVQFLLRTHSPKVFVEVGVAYGYHAMHILETNSHLNYIGIDPYIPDYDVKDPFSRDVSKLFPSPTPAQSMNRLHDAVLRNLETFSGRAKLIRETSQEAARKFSTNSVDMVFVDANHTFDQALADIRIWFTKLQPGGILVGDDWDWLEVRRAAEVFSEEEGIELWLLSSPKNDHVSFVMRKPN
jgi:SAM-dependent methyltransferase